MVHADCAMKLSMRELLTFTDLWSAISIRPREAKLLMAAEIRRVNRKPRRGKIHARPRDGKLLRHVAE